MSIQIILWLFLLSGVTAAINWQESVIHSKEFQDTEVTEGHEIVQEGLNNDLAAEIAALKIIINKQGLETAALRNTVNKQILDIAGMKEELTVLRETTYEQGLLIKAQDQDKFALKALVQKQENELFSLGEEIKEIQARIDKQGDQMKTVVKELIEKKQTATCQNNNIKDMRAETQNQTQLKNFSNMDNKKYNILKTSKRHNFISLLLTNNVPEAESKSHNDKENVQNRAIESEGIAFSAYLDHNVYHISSGYTLKCNQILLNVGSAYNAHTGTFTVPRTGVYLLTFFINSVINYIPTYVRLVVDNRNIVDAVSYPGSSAHDASGGNVAIVNLTAGESVWLEVYHATNGQLQTDGNYRYVTFSGVLLF